MKMYSRLLVILILYLTKNVEAILVGDFAPLEVGNVWKYVETNSNYQPVLGPTQSYLAWKGDVIVKIESSSISVDTSKYFGSFRDSIYKRSYVDFMGNVLNTLPDTTVKFNFELMDVKGKRIETLNPYHDALLSNIFLQHEFPDSDVVGISFYGSIIARVDYQSASYGKNIGMLMGPGGKSGQYVLSEFNNVKYASGLIRNGTVKYCNATWNERNSYLFHGGNWNLLGKRNHGKSIPNISP